MGFSTSYVSREGFKEGVILIKVQTVFGLAPSPLSCPKDGPFLTSLSHGQEGEDRAGLVDRGQRVSSDAVNVDNRVLVAVSVGWDVNLSMGGRMLK